MIPLMLTYKLIQESVTSVDVASGNFHIHYGHVGRCSLEVPKKGLDFNLQDCLLVQLK